MHTSSYSQVCSQARSAHPSANRCIAQRCSVPSQSTALHRSTLQYNERLTLPSPLSPYLATPDHRRAVHTMATQHGSKEGPHAQASSDTHQLAETQLVKGLSQIARQYKALLLDQFGVLHDGRRPYPGAIEAVAAAAASGLKLLIISNSSRRSTGTLDKLAKMGFDKSCFAGVVTSGELAHRYLTSRPDAWWAGLGTRVLHINWSRRGAASLDGYGLEVVTDPRDADFILAHGTEGVTLPPTDNGNGNGTAAAAAGGGVVVQERSVEELQELLAQAARVERGGGGRGRQGPPPMVVANPDLVTVDGDDLITMPGTLAAAYGAAGGHVVLMGKPAPLIYEACGELLGLPAAELLAVGDSLEHDIAGAAAAGIDSLFVAGGIHARELIPAAGGQQQGQQGMDMEALQGLCREHGRPAPTYALGRLLW